MNKSDILAANDLVNGRVETPEWQPATPFVHIRTMSGAERDAYEVEQVQIKGKDVLVNRQNMRARLLVRCICNEAGERLFGDDDAEALGRKSAKVLDRLSDVAQKLNGIGNRDVEELAGN